MYYLFFDTRGKAASLIDDYLNTHPRIAKEFRIKPVNNLKLDLVVYQDKECIWLIEFCLTDLESKLNSKQLEFEVDGDPKGNYFSYAQKLNAHNIAIIGGQIYNYEVYSRLNALMNEKYKRVYYFTPYTEKGAIEKAFEIIRFPPKEKIGTPTLTKENIDRGFALSISALLDGVSPDLACDLEGSWYVDITEKEIKNVINEHFNKGKSITKEYSELATKIYMRFQETWARPEKPKDTK